MATGVEVETVGACAGALSVVALDVVDEDATAVVVAACRLPLATPVASAPVSAIDAAATTPVIRLARRRLASRVRASREEVCIATSDQRRLAGGFESPVRFLSI